MADVVYDPDDLGAAISSGSFATIGMAVVPCSMRTLAAIATGNSTDLITRAADVCLKERRPLVLAVRALERRAPAGVGYDVEPRRSLTPARSAIRRAPSSSPSTSP